MVNKDRSLPEKREMNLWQRLAGIVHRPKATLAVVVENPTIIGPAAVISLANLALFSLTLPKLQQFRMLVLGSRTLRLSPEQGAQAGGYLSAWTVAGGCLTAAAVPFLGWLVITLLFKLFNLFKGKEVSFQQFYAISIITGLPVVFGSALRAVMVALSPAENFFFITTSAAGFLPKGSIGPLFVVLSQLDPFLLWSLILLAVGTAKALRIPAKKTGIFIFGYWVVYLAVLAGLSALNLPRLPVG